MRLIEQSIASTLAGKYSPHYARTQEKLSVTKLWDEPTAHVGLAVVLRGQSFCSVEFGQIITVYRNTLSLSQSFVTLEMPCLKRLLGARLGA